MNDSEFHKIIKLTLRRLRQQLEVPPNAFAKLGPDVFKYLTHNNLIAECYGGYQIVPRGFNWDVDKHCVRMPTFDEDIMERDAELENNP